MDLLRLYLVNILRPVVEDPRLSEHDDEEEVEKEDGFGEAGDFEAKSDSECGEKPGQIDEVTRRDRRQKQGATPKNQRESLKNIELLDSSGPKLIHGIQRWFVLYQIIGQLNWLERPLILSIIYKSVLISSCLYIVHKEIINSFGATRITDEFKNPIFVFISLSAVATLILLVMLTFYNNLFNWCPLFKVLTTEKLCFIRREIQDIIGNNTMPPILCFYAFNCVLIRMLATKNFQEFINNFSILTYIRDLFVFLCVGYHLVGMCYTDFYIRMCFGVWIIAMKTNLENRFAYLQKHQRVKQRSSTMRRSSQQISTNTKRILTGRRATSSSVMFDSSNATAASTRLSSSTHDANPVNEVDSQVGDHEVLSQNSSTIGDTSASPVGSGTDPNDGETQSQAQKQPIHWISNRMTLDDFRAKYKIDTMDEIQKNLNTMDDHLEVSRNFQNTSLVLITLSAFLTNGALLLLAYNLLANQGDFYHGFIIVLLAGSYTLTIFMCYIGDSWILYALESFVQTVEDEYFLQSASDENQDGNQFEAGRKPMGTKSSAQLLVDQEAKPVTRSASNEQDWRETPTLNNDISGESAPYAELIRKNHQLFIIKKHDVLFCREFLNQFQNHLATPWSKLTVKVQLHMLRTFVTLIAAQIIFDREH